MDETSMNTQYTKDEPILDNYMNNLYKHDKQVQAYVQNYGHAITIIKEDGSETSVDHIKPLNK